MVASTVLTLEGVSSPIPTPFTPDGRIDVENLAANLAGWNRQPLTAYIVGGSNGEFASLSVEERVEVVRQARPLIPTGRPLVAGAGSESTAETCALCERMAAAGADAVIVVTPGYYRGQLGAQALAAHYHAVAQASPVPVVLYNVPRNTGVDLPLAAILELAAHPNVIGVKDSGGDVTKLARIVQGAPPGFRVLAGSGGMLLPALAVGASGCIAALANLAASQLDAVAEAFGRRDLEAARERQAALLEVNHAVTAGFGVPGLKAALDLLGLYGGPVRPPLQPLSEAERGTLRAALQRAGLLEEGQAEA
jgi:4-hydroxy-2-oxoglutarate aldolase